MPSFTFLIENAKRLAAVSVLVALTACGGADEDTMPEPAAGTSEPAAQTVTGNVGGIILGDGSTLTRRPAARGSN